MTTMKKKQRKQEERMAEARQSYSRLAPHHEKHNHDSETKSRSREEEGRGKQT